MTVETRKRDSGGKGKYVVMTECNFCGEELQDGKGFAEHIGECEGV
jgi:hypothetical protein